MCATRKIFYRRRLPHIQPPGEIFFVTFRLAGSLPDHVIRQLFEWRDQIMAQARKASRKAERKKLLAELNWKYWGHFDETLNKALNGPTWLVLPHVAELVAEALHYRDGTAYDLLAYCIMSNHVHLIIAIQRNDTSLNEILQSLKAFTARRCNRQLARDGAFWHHESYDHIIRGGQELDRVVGYVINNPVDAGLCKTWKEWRWTYLREGTLEMF